MSSTIISWPGTCKLANGSPGHSQNQGLVEQGNQRLSIDHPVHHTCFLTGQGKFHIWAKNKLTRDENLVDLISLARGIPLNSYIRV